MNEVYQGIKELGLPVALLAAIMWFAGKHVWPWWIKRSEQESQRLEKLIEEGSRRLAEADAERRTNLEQLRVVLEKNVDGFSKVADRLDQLNDGLEGLKNPRRRK